MGLNANVKYMDEAMDRSMIAEPKISKILSESLNMPEEEAVQDLLGALQWDDALSGGTHDYAVELVQRIRKTKRKAGSLEAFFQQYSLSTKEGLALMSMAEALLRIPDVKTANALIRDKIAGTNWLKNSGNDKDWMAKATSLGLTLSSGTMNSLFSKVGEPVIREAIGKAMKILGKQFVIGETMAGAMRVAQKWEGKKAQGKGSYRFSYDMLGEGARTDRDAQRYFDGYKGALLDLADSVKKRGDLEADERAVRPGISVKLSALHPRYELAQEDICVPELTDRLVELCRIAAPLNIGLTIDAEEMARLGLSLKTIENICADSQFKGWDGFGLAVQAYHKAAPDVIDHIIHLAKTYERKMQIRLVKGAYWDSEIKHAQIEGFENYPVYTRKLNTDLSYLRCAQKMMRNRDVLYPMFGTHNAYSVAAIMKMDEGGAPENRGRYEFQKLYGMGDSLYDHIAKDHPETTICVYAPVGPYPDLLPYLVRRMLENGANSSFVNQIYDSDFEPSEIVSDPVEKARGNDPKYHPKIPLPKNLYGEQRVNSKGWDLDDEAVLEGLRAEIEGRFKTKNYAAMPLIAGKKYKDGVGYDKQNPAYLDDVVGHIYDAKMDHMQKAFDVAHQGYQMWSVTPASHRAKVLERFANLMEENTAELMALCIREGGKTYRDARDEIREAVDFCRYYALRGRLDFVPEGKKLVGPTGETDILKLEPRGIFICISPWNFPLAIFTGQVVAALMAGNAVIAKPAEQTSLI
ncbi:MAG: bifunctional proline dehydrogenase/L-glutamate gamma-semialdehyde dehydrogenase PutA, partial [Alphaproteobacteria bacterium]|nr:bifunctional proline dehydrogenase/L-glutamate gamma-semialdehyde dehydrogenase PutA [Alphaproteobacteria bacterium]